MVGQWDAHGPRRDMGMSMGIGVGIGHRHGYRHEHWHEHWHGHVFFVIVCIHL